MVPHKLLAFVAVKQLVSPARIMFYELNHYFDSDSFKNFYSTHFLFSLNLGFLLLSKILSARFHSSFYWVSLIVRIRFCSTTDII